MATNKILRSVGLLMAPLIFVGGAFAQDPLERTKVTVNQSIEVPGAVLPAGTYVFRLVDPYMDPHVVLVFNEREDRLLATVIAVNDYRAEPIGKTVLNFGEAPAGKPAPVREWFYPGNTIGHEFVYPAK